MELLNDDAPRCIGVGILLLEAGRDSFHLGAGLIERDARLEPRYYINKIAAARVPHPVADRERHPKLDLFPRGRHRVLKTGGQHADDRVWVAVHRDLATNDFRVAAEPSLPKLLAQNDNAVFALLAFLRQEFAAEGRLDAE